MNVIVTGASGLLGRAVVTEFKSNGWKVLGLAHTRVRGDLIAIDLRDINAISSIVREFKPHAIIHCAAERSPDKIQMHPNQYYNLNTLVPGELAKLADEVKAVYVFISSDYVFPGEDPPYGEEQVPAPLNYYGLSKMKAEEQVIWTNKDSVILRIPVIYGGEEFVKESAISSLINAIKEAENVPVSNLEVRYPTHTSDVARTIYELVQVKLLPGSCNQIVFHHCGMEPFTKYQMLTTIAEAFGRSHDHVIPIHVAVPAFTPRPLDCQLSCLRLERLNIIPRHTQFSDGIQEYSKFFE